MSQEELKNRVPPSPWVVKKETLKEDTKWTIENDKAEMEIYAYKDRFADGIHIEGFYIDYADSTTKYLSRSEFRELLEKILACMKESGREKIHAQPDSKQMIRVFESLGARIEVPQPDESTPLWYIMDKSNLETIYHRLGGQAV